MTEYPSAQPEGLLIKAALDASPLSQRQAAKRADISETWWRNIVSGYQSISGVPAALIGSSDTVARMAHVVGVTPEQLEAAGRPDAAAALRDIEARTRQAASAPRPADAQARVDERWPLVEAVLRQAGSGLDPSEHGTLRGRIDVFFAENPEWQPPDDVPAAGGRRRSRKS